MTDEKREALRKQARSSVNISCGDPTFRPLADYDCASRTQIVVPVYVDMPLNYGIRERYERYIQLIDIVTAAVKKAAVFHKWEFDPMEEFEQTAQ